MTWERTSFRQGWTWPTPKTTNTFSRSTLTKPHVSQPEPQEPCGMSTEGRLGWGIRGVLHKNAHLCPLKRFSQDVFLYFPRHRILGGLSALTLLWSWRWPWTPDPPTSTFFPELEYRWEPYVAVPSPTWSFNTNVMGCPLISERTEQTQNWLTVVNQRDGSAVTNTHSSSQLSLIPVSGDLTPSSEFLGH